MGDAEDQEDTPISVIIIVACVCGAIILILLIILICLCYRRHRAQKKSSGTASPSGQPVITHPGDKPGDSGQPAVNGRGVENPGLDNIDLDDPSNTRVFATDTSSKVGPYGDIYAQPMKRQPNGQANGHVGNGQPPQWGAPQSQCLPSGPPPKYDGIPPRSTSPENPYVNGHKAKRKNPDHQYLQLEDPYASHQHTPHETSKEGSSDSGVSTPDPQKPKKVIYEVIV